jgi:hypothetical protein
MIPIDLTQYTGITVVGNSTNCMTTAIQFQQQQILQFQSQGYNLLNSVYATARGSSNYTEHTTQLVFGKPVIKDII